MLFSNTYAVMEAILGKKSDFERTPKYNYFEKKRVLSFELQMYRISKNYFIMGAEVLLAIYLNSKFYSLFLNLGWMSVLLFPIITLGLNMNLFLILKDEWESA